MNTLLLPILILRLVLLNLKFFLKLFFIKQSYLKPTIIIISFALFFLSLLFFYSKKNTPNTNSTKPNKNNIQIVSLDNKKTYQIESFEDSTLVEIQNLERKLDKQPNQRDVFINLAILYNSLNDVEKSSTYLNRAKKLDPNNEVFLKKELDYKNQ